VTAQDLYIRDLEHCVRELQRIVDRFHANSSSSNNNNSAEACARDDLMPPLYTDADLCDVLVPQPPSFRAPVTDVSHSSFGT